MALNKWIGMGRLTAAPELKVTTSGTPVTSFTIAVDRDYSKSQDGKKETDFINIVAWRNTAEFICKYFGKGSLICVVGSLQTRSYTAQDNSKRTVTEVVASEVQFTGEKKEANTAQNSAPAYGAKNDTNYEELSEDDELPF